ncbi:MULTISPECIES: DUF1517 domain-containing protein [unclassified Coleofasciculus]|uniref:DUF1517 domain-containing protein n=1 Tax=unclassified Coleofasciculus TaxID=2692782 RepID=UPI00188055C1|nr:MULTISPECIES: DUF1517 domain-containing protein [unclassified Coleofasciculus]MBE9127248.1 DUF1517 domain-containing protein [Coleofasciculus sp. LEGE 07081]MBE9150600.1 DUF1517 domain-containing protein [Coleofasciculus sp. LEGE 07092]
MLNKLFSTVKPFLKSLLVLGLIFTLVMGNAGDALAARSGGRIGGGSFRAPSRTYSPPSRGYRSPGGGYGYSGGGIGFPFLLPFFGFGGFGSVFGILIFFALANFLVQTFRRMGEVGGNDVPGYSNPKVSVGQVQVGLLAEARELQKELDDLARKANTDSAEGRAQVLQEGTLALLRHPEYWVYGAASSQQTGLDAAEGKFNQLSLAERSKFTEETLSNVRGQLRQGTSSDSDSRGELLKTEAPSEYIIVTILAGVQGKLDLPTINGSDDLRQALRQLGGVSSDRLLAVEVLWTPQAEGDTLTSDDLLAGYPDIKLV